MSSNLRTFWALQCSLKGGTVLSAMGLHFFFQAQSGHVIFLNFEANLYFLGVNWLYHTMNYELLSSCKFIEKTTTKHYLRQLVIYHICKIR